MVAKYLNSLSDDLACQTLQSCCASQTWVRGMMTARPFTDDEAVYATACRVAETLERDDWLEAFAAHPIIGDLKTLRAKYANTKKWAQGEQAGVQSADEQTIMDLARDNDRYLEKFDHIFIVCATGKSATEMLQLLQSRILNSIETELAVAAAEQLKITLLRLGKLKQ